MGENVHQPQPRIEDHCILDSFTPKPISNFTIKTVFTYYIILPLVCAVRAVPSMIVADILVPNTHQAISNDHAEYTTAIMLHNRDEITHPFQTSLAQSLKFGNG